MYSRPPNNRFPRGMRVPENYSGNAFGTASDNDREEMAIQAEEDIQNQENAPSFLSSEPNSQSLPASKSTSSSGNDNESRPSFSLNLGRFFPTNRSFGMEEFLIIALILLLAQNDTDDDTLIFLILLLFIK